MYKSFFCFVVAVSLVAGCRQREDVDRLKIINQGWENANNIIKDDNRFIGENLIARALIPRSKYYGEKWEPRGNRIRKEADSLVVMIESIKNRLLKQTDSMEKEDPSFIKQLYVTNGSGYELAQRLATFKSNIPAIVNGKDTSVQYMILKNNVLEIHTKAPLMVGYSDSLNNDKRMQFIKNWLEKNFSGASSLMAMVVLNKIENDLLATTKLFLQFCLSQTEVHSCRVFDGIAVLSSSYVKQGQPIEVTAGIADFDTAIEPRIMIGGKEIAIDKNDGAAVYRFAAKGTPGKYKIRVEFEYTKPDGAIERVYKDLNYIIADEK